MVKLDLNFCEEDFSPRKIIPPVRRFGHSTKAAAVVGGVGGTAAPPSSPLSLPVSLQTPVSNTGSNSPNDGHLEVWIDFLQGTIRCTTLEKFHQCVEFIAHWQDSKVPIVYETKPLFAGIVWANQIKTCTGIKIGYNLDEFGGVHAWFSLPGGYFHQIDALDHWRICTGLDNVWGFKANRMDWKVRDYSRSKTPTEIYDYCVAGNVALVRKYEISGNGSVGSSPTMTIYLGSKQSEKFLRVYDAMPVHNVNAIDWELQCRDEKAQVTFKAFCAIQCNCIDENGNEQYDSEMTHDLVAKFIATTVCGAVDFVERTDKNLARCKRLDWWQDFCDACGGRLRMPCGRKSPTLEKTLQWIDKQVSVVMSALKKGYGKEHFSRWLNNMLDAAEDRYNSYHEGIIYMCKQQKELKTEICYG